ncbi:MAG: flagellar motor protein [Pseudomonadota bacterium]
MAAPLSKVLKVKKPVSRPLTFDPLSLIGALLGTLAVIGGNALEGGQIASLVNGPAMVIVIGGTVGATLLQTPLPIFLRALKLSSEVFTPPVFSFDKAIDQIVAWANLARREGLLALESGMEQESDRFIRKGMQAVVDGFEPEVVRALLDMELETQEAADIQASRVFEGMGGYSPTIGIIGAVMGLIHVMQNLADPSRLGAGIATAFVATIYGVGLANLFMLPMGAKLRAWAQLRTHYRRMLIEGMVAICEGENPRAIESKLRGFLL